MNDNITIVSIDDESINLIIVEEMIREMGYHTSQF
jgi:hypothetical protein